MKYLYLAIAAVITLSGCAGTRVVRTDVASGATSPKSIYIRPFTVHHFNGDHKGKARQEILKSQAPAEFAVTLKEELETLAPAMVINDNEIPSEGWVVEGNLDLIHSGYPPLRAILGFLGAGRSEIKVHVRVLDATTRRSSDGKSGNKSNVLYEFDVRGGSRLSGAMGSLSSSGLGYSPSFDYRNAAMKITEVLTPNGARHAYR